MTFTVPDGLMQRLVFTDDAVSPDQVPPRIPADLPVVFSPVRLMNHPIDLKEPVRPRRRRSRPVEEAGGRQVVGDQAGHTGP